MTSRMHLFVSFLVFFAFFMLGRVGGFVWGGNYSALVFEPYSVPNLLELGVACVFFSSIFFGRTAFLVFGALGWLLSPVISFETLLLNVAAGMGLAVFGVLGAEIGSRISEDLQDREPFELLNRQLGALLLTGIVFSAGTGVLAGNILEINNRTLNALSDFRTGKIDLFSAIVSVFGIEWTPPQQLPPDDNTGIDIFGP